MAESLESLLAAALDTCHDAPADYMLYGGIVAGLWGEPRLTEDVDIVLFLAEREFARFLRAAAAHGFHCDESLAYQQIQIAGWSRIPFGLVSSLWHLDVTLGDSPFDMSARSRRREVRLFGRKVLVVSPEDLVLYKTIAVATRPERMQDLVDVEAVFRRMGPQLDGDYLRAWAAFWEKEGVEGVADRIEKLVSTWARPGDPA